MICNDYDSNAIILIFLKTREGSESLRAYKVLNKYLTDRGLKSQIQRLDKEVLSNLKKTITKLHVKYQVLPSSHCCNPVERAIQPWKDRYIAGLSIIDKKIPMHLTCRLCT